MHIDSTYHYSYRQNFYSELILLELLTILHLNGTFFLQFTYCLIGTGEAGGGGGGASTPTTP